MLTILIMAAHAAEPHASFQEEMDRNLRELSLDGESAPYFIRYNIQHIQYRYISAYLGGIVDRSDRPSRTLEASVRVGRQKYSRQCSDVASCPM